VIELFAGAGRLPVAAFVVVAATVVICTLVRHLSGIIWAVRCPPDSGNYRCPSPPGRQSALSDLFKHRDGGKD